MRGALQRVARVAAIGLVLLQLLALGERVMVCRLTGELLRKCCCDDGSVASGDDAASVGEPCCCDTHETRPARMAAHQASPAADGVPQPAGVIPVGEPPLVTPHSARHRGGTRATGPPSPAEIYLLQLRLLV